MTSPFLRTDGWFMGTKNEETNFLGVELFISHTKLCQKTTSRLVYKNAKISEETREKQQEIEIQGIKWG